jgi:hypothetical protein
MRLNPLLSHHRVPSTQYQIEQIALKILTFKIKRSQHVKSTSIAFPIFIEALSLHGDN